MPGYLASVHALLARISSPIERHFAAAADDPPEVRLRLQSVPIAIWLTLLVCGGGEAYVLGTWDRPHRGAITTIFLAALASLAVVWALPMRRIVLGAYRELFFVAWSGLDLVLIAVVAGLDGGTTSPFTIAFVLPLIFASISYPRRSVLATGVLVLVAFLGAALSQGKGLAPRDGLIALGIASASLMSAAQARTLNQQRSELAEAVGAAQEAEERFRSAFDNAPIGVALVDVRPGMRQKLLNVNRAMRRITGYSREDLLAMDFQELSDPESRREDATRLEQLVAGDVDDYMVERRYLHAEGRAIWLELNASLVRDASGGPLHAIVQAQDVSERKRFEGQLQYLADHDPLTGLYNRRVFEREVANRLAEIARYGGRGAVLVLDVDHFKYVNDTLGHPVGDDLIGRLASMLRKRLRDTDVLARLGGDEFGVLVPHADEEQAMALAEQLLRQVRDEAVVMSEGRALRMTASIGVAPFAQESRQNADSVIVNADIAMYQAKQNGRNRVELLVSTEQSQATMRARLTLSERLRHALAHDGFALYAQPILDVRKGAVTRHELLLRMAAESGEMIPPVTFLHVAEEFGLIQAVDRWVIHNAVALIGEHPERKLTLEVNLSGASITDPGVIALVEQELADSGIDPRSLVFEVTETAAIVNIEQANRFARRLAELGCAFALDDFGAGFGSFYYLKHLPFDFLKIDGDFIRKLPSSAPDQLTVKAIVQIAHGLKKKTIAECVEDEATLGLLKRYGVDFAQGYRIGVPQPARATFSDHEEASQRAAAGRGSAPA